MTYNSSALLESYARLGSVHKVGQEFGVTGETARKRMIAAGWKPNTKWWTAEDDAVVREAFAGSDPVDVKTIAARLGRSVASVHVRAHGLGVSCRRGQRRMSDAHKLRMMAGAIAYSRSQEGRARAAERLRGVWARNGHPRGMLGKHHTQDVREAISAANTGRKVPVHQVEKSIKSRYEKYGSISTHRPHATWKAGWRTVGGKSIYFRSRWEFNYAAYLESLRVSGSVSSWVHEPKAFLLSTPGGRVRGYLPDFQVTLAAGDVQYHEVKGWMDERSREKLVLMSSQHPSAVIVLIDKAWFRKHEKTLSQTIPGWEKRERNTKCPHCESSQSPSETLLPAESR